MDQRHYWSTNFPSYLYLNYLIYKSRIIIERVTERGSLDADHDHPGDLLVAESRHM